MTRLHHMQTDRAQQRTFRPRLHVGRCLYRASLLVNDVLSGVSVSMQRMRHCACRLGAVAPRLAPHSALHWLAGFLCVPAHVRVRSTVQMACPERVMPIARLAFAGRQAAPCVAPPGHRIPVPSGRGKRQGKIEGSGTLPAHERVCTWGWRGTRLWAAPCREGRQSLVDIGETACMARRGSMAFAGATP